jgi:membrane-bound lytic murein transglycosylase MltF
MNIPVNRMRSTACYLSFLFFIIFLFVSVSEAVHPDKHNPLAAHFKKQYTDDLDGLLKRRYIRVLTTFNRTNFFIAGGKQYGFEYSLLKDYEKFLNKKIKRRDLKVVVDFIPVSRDKLLPLLVEGYGDIAAAGLTITPERLKKVNFTDPYLKGVDEIIVIHKSVKGLKTLYDLSGRIVYIRESSSYYENLQELNRRFKQKGLRPVRIQKANEELETEDILEMVNSGAVKITVSDSHIATIWSKIFHDIILRTDLKIKENQKIAWMVRKNNPLLRNSLNRFLKTHKKGTLLGNIYFNRYYKNTKWIKNPLSKSERAKLEKYKKLFKKYAQAYGFDWMLVMALAYQESGLDNNKKSHTGAVGVMQILPRTAADKRINIRDVHKVENNIHAGVKYLAFLRDRYFNEKQLRERDRVRFVLAAYNAGPTKIKRARALARKMGLNPDKWFRNVEMAVLKIVGQETVQYVSNINKYYLLFRAAFQWEKVRQEKKKRLS